MKIDDIGKLVNEMNVSRKDYLDVLGLKLAIDEDDPNSLYIPASFAWAIYMGFSGDEEGTKVSFNIFYEDAVLKEEFRKWLKAADIIMPAALTFTDDNPFQIAVSQVIPWAINVPEKASRFADLQFEQFRKFVNEWCDAILPKLRNFYEPRARVLLNIKSLVGRIVPEFQKVLPESKGWIYERGDFGSSLYPDFPLFWLTRQEWNESSNIEFCSESLFSAGLHFCLTQSAKRSYKRDPKIQAFYAKWRDRLAGANGTGEKSFSQSKENAGLVYLPKSVCTWTRGDFAGPDFQYALDETGEKQVLQFCQKCAEAFACSAAEMDEIAR